MRTLSILLVLLFVSAARAQQTLEEQKAQSGTKFGETALKSKAAALPVKGRYGKKLPPSGMSESKKRVVLKDGGAPPAPKTGKKEDGTPLSTKDVVAGTAAIIGAPILLLMLLGGGGRGDSPLEREILKEKIRQGK